MAQWEGVDLVRLWGSCLLTGLIHCAGNILFEVKGSFYIPASVDVPLIRFVLIRLYILDSIF